MPMMEFESFGIALHIVLRGMFPALGVDQAVQGVIDVGVARAMTVLLKNTVCWAASRMSVMLPTGS